MISANKVLSAGSSIYVDRPDVVKKEQRQRLSFKEVKDLLFKYLMQVGIPFERDVKVQLALNIYYKATCKLHNITVDGKPVYIVMLPLLSTDLEYRHANKYLAFKQKENVIVFDVNDYSKIGVNITEKEWLEALSAKTAKRLTRILFEKLATLKGTIQSNYTLNELLESIDRTTSSEPVSRDQVERLKSENSNLLFQLRKASLEQHHRLEFSQDPVILALNKLSRRSTKWVELVMTEIIETLSTIDLRSKGFKNLFKTLNGRVIIKKEKDFVSYLVNSLLVKHRTGIKLVQLTDTLLEIQNKKTFQKIYVNMVPQSRSGIRVLSFDTKLLKKIKSGLVYNVYFSLGSGGKRKSYQVDVIHTKNFTQDGKYATKVRLPVFDSSKQNDFILWRE